MQAHVRPVQQKLLSVNTVVRHHRTRASDAYKKLLTFPVCVFATGFNARYAEDEKISFGDEGKVSIKFADGNTASDVGYTFNAVNFDAFDGGWQDRFALWR